MASDVKYSPVRAYARPTVELEAMLGYTYETLSERSPSYRTHPLPNVLSRARSMCSIDLISDYLFGDRPTTNHAKPTIGW